MRLSRITAVSTVLVAGLVLAGCGSDAKTEPSASASAKASATPKAETIDPVKFVTSVSHAVDNAGTYDFAIDMGLAGQVAGVVASTNPADMRMSMSMKAGGATTEAVVVGSTMYVKTAETSGMYMSVDLNSPEAASLGIDLNAIDPSASTRGAIESVISVKETDQTKEIDGVAVSAYEVTMDSAKMVASGALDASTLPEGTEFPEEIVYTYWVDHENLMYETQTTLMGLSVTMTMSNFGGGQTVEAPAADQVVPMSQLTQG